MGVNRLVIEPCAGGWPEPKLEAAADCVPKAVETAPAEGLSIPGGGEPNADISEGAEGDAGCCCGEGAPKGDAAGAGADGGAAGACCWPNGEAAAGVWASGIMKGEPAGVAEAAAATLKGAPVEAAVGRLNGEPAGAADGWLNGEPAWTAEAPPGMLKGDTGGEAAGAGAASVWNENGLPPGAKPAPGCSEKGEGAAVGAPG